MDEVATLIIFLKKTKIDAINVIIDCAEIGVNLSADFTGAAKSEEHFQNVLQVVAQTGKRDQTSGRGNQLNSAYTRAFQI